MNIFINFAKRIVNIYRFLAKKILRQISLKLKFLNFKFRILNIDKYELIELNDLKVLRYGLSSNFEELIFRIFTLLENSELNIFLLEKFLLIINYSSKRKFYLDYIERFLKDFKFDFNKLPNLAPYIIDPFTLVGDYKTAEKFRLILRKKRDEFYNRDVGLYDERSYLTAIGHLCLFSYYLKSREVNFLGEDKSTFLFNKNKIANNLFFELIKEKAKKLDVVIKETNKKFDYFNHDEHEIELWPFKEKKTYVHASSIKGIIEEKWRDINNTDKFFFLSNEKIANAKKLLKSLKILQSNNWFVGIHLRMTNDKKILRNGNYKNIIHICDLIRKQGGEVIFIGTDKFSGFNNTRNITFLNELNISRSDNELLQLYIWSQSSFFVGNLSGGTIPPSLFGTPIIWVDIHPTSHVRNASQLDVVIPKKVFDINNKKFISFNEANSFKHFKCQTESEYLAQLAGYKILPSDIKIINQVIEYYISKHVFKNQYLSSDFFAKDHYVPSPKGAFYKF